MLTEFGKIFLFMMIAAIFVFIGLVAAKMIRPSRPTKEKLMTYECGEEPIGSPWVKFNIRFYVVALIFLIFDVEVVLLFPWALAYKEFGMAGYLVGAIFLFVLGLGMVYEWRKGDLEWVRPSLKTAALKNQVLQTKSTIIQKETEPIKI